jgi:phosphatidylserine/phosphatidylglycerophosphate/cardiolipin synthase-like enzyme
MKDLQSILQQTLEDQRLSRGERRALREVLEKELQQARDHELLRSQAFALARGALQQAADRSVLDWLEDVLGISAHIRSSKESDVNHVQAEFSPGEACRALIVHQLKACRQSADVCVFTITDNEISAALRKAFERNVHVRILTDNDKAEDLGSDVRDLSRAGISVAFDSSPHHMHHKFAIFDQSKLLTGSYNWTRSAARHNEENIVLMDDRRLVEVFQQEFDRLWTLYG